MHGANAIRQGNMQAGAALLTGAGKLGGMAYNLYGTGTKATTPKPDVPYYLERP
jgi:hypothetical protein